MKRPLIILLLIAFISPMKAQPAMQINYRYLLSPAWDRIVQTYNVSRPWNSEQLQPITHGTGALFAWNLPVRFARAEALNRRALHMNFKLGYHRFGSVAENFGQRFNVGFHQFELSADLRTHPKCLFKPVQNTGDLGTSFYIGIGAGFNALMPFVRNDGRSIADGDDNKYRERSYAFSGQLLTGYHLMMIANVVITSEFGLNWFRSAELFDFAESVNGHNLTGMENEAVNVMMLQASLRFTWMKKKSNWWDKPRSGDKS
jgi:hypothetical protein